MVIKTYSDGSEFTVAHAFVAGVAAVAIAIPAFMVYEKYVDWKTQRIMKKYGWPIKAYTK